MEVRKSFAFSIAALIAGVLAPLAWLAFLFSNRDPFILGACIVVTAIICPLSAIVAVYALNSATAVRWRRLLLGSLLLNAVLFASVLGLLLSGLNRRV